MAILSTEANAVLKLSDLERVAVSLAIQGRTKAEIAGRMNLKVKSIEKLISNANRKLADLSSKGKS